MGLMQFGYNPIPNTVCGKMGLIQSHLRIVGRDLAEEIRLSRFRLSSSPTSYPPISKRWVDRFRKRYPELKTIYSRALDASRFEGANYPVINAFFEALTDLFLKNSYSSNAIFNVDETGFALGTTLPSKVLIRGGDTRAFKKISGRQE